MYAVLIARNLDDMMFLLQVHIKLHYVRMEKVNKKNLLHNLKNVQEYKALYVRL